MSLPSPAFVAPTTGDATDIPAQRRRVYDLDTNQPKLIVPLSTGDVTITVESVTPELADEWLETYNTRNRTLYADRSEGLARDMNVGSFVFNGDTIRFAVYADGPRKGEAYLADGQHRLDAIRKSEVAQPCLIVRGLPADAQETIDTGKTRTFADTLRLDGWSNENHIAAITRALLLWERDIIVGVNSGGRALGLTTKPELGRYLEEHQDEIKAALRVVGAMSATGLKFATGASKMATAWVLTARLDREAADLFIVDHAIQGKHLDDGHPAKALRDRLLRTDMHRPTPGEAFLLTLWAWNIWRDNRTVSKLQAPSKGWPLPSEFRLR